MAQGGSGEDGKTVRESSVTVRHEGTATVREGEVIVPEGAVTVRESGVTMREGGAAVPEGGATVRESPASSMAAAPAREPQAAGWLPRALSADYRVIESLPAYGAEADLYVVGAHGDDAARRVAKVYRQGIKPKEDVLKRVRAADPSHVVRIESHGEDAGRWWELMEYAERGSLRMLIEREGPKFPEPLVAEILRQMNEALAGLHALSLEHRDLKPANVLVRNRDPLDLALTDFGISSVMSATMHRTGAARTIRYAPPEAIGSGVVIERTTWDYWSLGMMLVEMLQGAHPYDGLSEAMIVRQLSTQDVDHLTEYIEDPRWRKLCRGLLRRTPAARWDEEAVAKWLADPDDPSLDVAEEAPAAGQGADIPLQALISFDGGRYSTPAELGAALAMDWTKASSFWKRRYGDVQNWVTDDLGLPELGDALKKIDDSDLSLDQQVFSFVYLLAPNAPVRFRDEDLSVEGLAALAWRAAEEGDPRAREMLLALHRHEIPMLAGSLPHGEELADVSRRWADAVRDYERLRRKLGAQRVTVPQPGDETLAILLAASIPDSPVVEPLRGQARAAGNKDARRCAWYSGLGSPEDMSIAALAMLPQLQARAEFQGRKSRGRPWRGFIGGAIVGGLFALLASRALIAGDPPELATMTMLPLWFYAIGVVRFWYRENKLAGAWSSFFKGLFGAYRLLDLRPEDPLRWPLIIIGIFALLLFLAVSAGLAMLAASPLALAISQGGGTIMSRTLLLSLAGSYTLLGGCIGLLAHTLRQPLLPTFRTVRRVLVAHPRAFLVIAVTLPFILLLL